MISHSNSVKIEVYKLDCCLSERDTHVVSCSEDGKVFFWDLVEVSLCTGGPARSLPESLPGPYKGVLLELGAGRMSERGDEARTFLAKGTACAKARGCGTHALVRR